MTAEQSHSRIAIHMLAAAIPALDARAVADRDSVLSWIDSGAELCRRIKPDVPRRHLVSYVVPVDREAGMFLLGAHRTSGLWLPPGGHVEADEHPARTAVRECEEELGLALPLMPSAPLFLTSTMTTGDVGRHVDVSFWYTVRATAGETFAFDEREFAELRWFSVDALPEHGDPELARFIRACSLALNKP
jgi:8-oxo-dGTP pyrophosphatase MutT (NUDIX family)